VTHPTSEFVFVHFGDPERAKTIQKLFQRLQKETNIQLSEEMKEALADPIAASQISKKAEELKKEEKEEEEEE
jgi:hypothetical protein